MDILDKYFELQNNMSSISKTNCSEKEINQYFESGEQILNILDKVVAQFNGKWGETPPVMYCRDELPDMYMRYEKWGKAKSTIDKCYKAGILDESERYEQLNWVNNCEIATKEVVNHLHKYPGTLQKDMYSRLHYVDKESLKWVLRFYKKLEKIKYRNTNKLFLPEQKDLIQKELEIVEKENIKEESENTNKLPDISTDSVFPEWYVSISFGESTSKNYNQAVALAKLAPQYIENIIDGKVLHQAIFSDKPNEYLQFIKLYELVSNWKSCYVVINGVMADRKIVGNLNYCYGDKCRSGKTDFCHGASEFTSNPFGCHRAQMHAYNDPWYSYGIMDTKGIFHIDKNSIKNELISRLSTYKLCPALNMDTILNNVDNLPNTINPKLDKDWEYTTIIKNGIPFEGVQPTLEARGLAYTITVNINSDTDDEERDSFSVGTDKENNQTNYDSNLKDSAKTIDKKKTKVKRSFFNNILGVISSLFLYFILITFPILIINNALLGAIIVLVLIYPSFKLGFRLTDKLFAKKEKLSNKS